MADIFVSYTSKDRDWAFWIGQELDNLGHVAHIDAWEISAGGNIADWMEQRTDAADQMVFVISKAYLDKPYASWERRSAQWAARTKGPNFAVPIRIDDCELPILLDPLKRCDLFGIDESTARSRLAAFMEPATKHLVAYPGAIIEESSEKPVSDPVSFPGASHAFSNIPISLPKNFLGRADDLVAIEQSLGRTNDGVAISALHGLRGVGKTTLAAAYAEQHRDKYRATWWIRAETGPTMRADLVGLGVQLGWVAIDAAEKPAVALVKQKLRDEGDGLLLIYDNANNADEIRPYLPLGGLSHIVITSNAPNWSGVAASVGIQKWSSETGADYLIAQVGRPGERNAALALSTAMDGLPLAHEQAAAYCARTGLPLSNYHKRFEAEPIKVLDAEKDAPQAYHNRRTAAKTFLLAIEGANKLHAAAGELIIYAALLPPEPIPLYIFSEGREKLSKRFASKIKNDGLDEAVAALRAFALIDRELISDERDPSITTDCIRLHRLVRQVAISLAAQKKIDDRRRELIEALAAIYPPEIYDEPQTWPKARRIDPLAVELVDGKRQALPNGAERPAIFLLNKMASYRQRFLAAYVEAGRLFEHALTICKGLPGSDHDTATNLNDLALLRRLEGNYADARSLFERAEVIWVEVIGPDHPGAAQHFYNVSALLSAQGNYQEALEYSKRALAIFQNTPDHRAHAKTLNQLGSVHMDLGELEVGKSYAEQALAIFEREVGPDHPNTAMNLNILGRIKHKLGDIKGARGHIETALEICRNTLGPDHPDTAVSLNNLGIILFDLREYAEARSSYDRALAIREKKFGLDHPDTKIVVADMLALFDHLQLTEEATAIRQKYGLKDNSK